MANKRCLECPVDELMLKKFKDTEWDEFLDVSPSCTDFSWETVQDCRMCNEPIQAHNYFQYYSSSIFGNERNVAILKCDRKIIRCYYGHIPMPDWNKPYSVFLNSHVMDVYEANEGRYTQ